MRKPPLKTYSLLLIAASLFFQVGFAQSNVMFRVQHKQGLENFAFEQMSNNDLGQFYDLTRVQYYLNEIVLVHDGGTETSIDDTFLLIDAGENSTYSLGSHPITTIEGIRFSVGVEPDFNHLDPATYPADHPLAPQLPSMHWGWAAGYKFVAIEGHCDASSSLSKDLEVHALGDANYFEVDIPLSATPDGSTLWINVAADYDGALTGIDLSDNVLLHGEIMVAVDLLENFRDNVFSVGEPLTGTSTGIVDVANPTIDVFPVPASGGILTIRFDQESEVEQQLIVTALSGRQIADLVIPSNQTSAQIQLETPGIYLLTINRNGQPYYGRKIVVE